MWVLLCTKSLAEHALFMEPITDSVHVDVLLIKNHCKGP